MALPCIDSLHALLKKYWFGIISSNKFGSETIAQIYEFTEYIVRKWRMLATPIPENTQNRLCALFTASAKGGGVLRPSASYWHLSTDGPIGT